MYYFCIILFFYLFYFFYYYYFHILLLLFVLLLFSHFIIIFCIIVIFTFYHHYFIIILYYYLDHNKISYGKLGPPPPLPDRRCRKLLQLISSSASAYERRGSDWFESRLPLFDSAFTAVTDTAAMEYEKETSKYNDYMRTFFSNLHFFFLFIIIFLF